MKQLALATGLFILTLYAQAGSMGHSGPKEHATASPCYAELGIGYTHLHHASDNDAVNQRIAIGRHTIQHRQFNFALELGVQTGMRARMDAEQTQLDVVGGTSIQATLYPIADFLLVISKAVSDNKTLFAKLGPAYRHLAFDNDVISNQREINPEVQVGLNMTITESSAIGIAYQGIFSGNPGFQTSGPQWLGKGGFSHIPTQQGFLISFKHYA